MIYSTKESRTESLFRKIRNSVKEINEAVEKLEKAQLFSEGTTSDQHVATDTNVGDTISRQAVYDALNNIQIPRNESWYCYYQQALTAVSKLPPAQPERKRGEWVEISSINHTYKCSECGRLLVNVADGKNNVSKHYPYCHCGADMRGESE